MPLSHDDLAGRDLLSSLCALLGLSVAMAGCSPTEIVDLAASTVPWLTCGRADASVSHHWHDGVSRGGWVWPLPVHDGPGGAVHLVVRAPEPLSETDRAVLQALAEQTTVASATASRLVRERERVLQARDHAYRLRWLKRAYGQLASAAAAAGGASGIAEALYGLSGLPVVIEDRVGQVLATAGTDSSAVPFTPRAFTREEMLQQALVRPTPRRYGDRVVAPVVAPGGILAVIYLIDPTARARLVDRDALRHAAAVLSVQLVAVRASTRTESDVARQAIDDLLTGEDRTAAVTNALALGFAVDHARVVVVESERRIPEDFFLASVRRHVEGLAVGGICTVHSGAVVFVAGEAGKWDALHSAIVNDVAHGCRIGVGGLSRDAAQLPVSYRQAKHALKLQRILPSSKPVSVFEELGIYRVLSEMHDSGTVEDFVHDWLGPILDYDRRKGGELVRTLSVYLEHGGSHAGAAEALSVHRSTLRYRLDRIRSILGCDLSDPDKRFNLQLATRIWTTQEALETAAGS
jgi:PucR C-terminal helix-turn-helix domain/GGDEF-like domain